jgi:PST family polysaccharide transporter
MFGENWLTAVPCFQVLSLSLWSQLLISSTGVIFQSTNNTKGMLKTALINTSITIIMMICGLYMGKIEYVALFVSFAYIFNYVITFDVLMKETFYMKLRHLNKVLLLDFIYAIIMIVVSIFIISFINIDNVLISLFIKLILTMVLYCIYLFLSGKYKIFINILKGR